MAYPINVKLLDKYNRPRTALNPKGLEIHSTSDPRATADNEVQYFQTGDREASAHYFIDWTTIDQDIPDNEEAWHAGPMANSMYLSVELCEIPNEGSADSKAKFQAAWDRLIWFSAMKCIQYNWNPTNAMQLCGHFMTSARWHETDHTDPCGADGKGGYLGTWGKTWADLVNEVVAEIASLKAPQEIPLPPNTLYVVTATTPLNERATPNTNAVINGQIPPNTVIVVTAKVGAWFKTSWGPKGGYVYGQYVKPYTPAPVEAPNTAPTPIPTPNTSPAPEDQIQTVPAVTNPFQDIEGHWAKATIIDLYNKGILKGDGTAQFHPNIPPTRAEVAVMIEQTLKYLGK